MRGDHLTDPLASVAIDVRDVRRSFQQHGQTLPVLQGVNLRVLRGESVALQGASGAGKSTLLSILGLIDVEYEGTYELEGQDPKRATDAQRATMRLRRLGLAFQDLWLIPSLTALENCLVPQLGAGVKESDARSRAEEVLRAARLAHCLHRRPSELSGGERRRVAFARALVNRPQILILDEPTAELDDEAASACLDLIQDARRGGATIVAASHDERLLATCHRRLRLIDGRLESTAADRRSF